MRHQEAIEGGPAYPQKFGGLHFVAAALLQGGRDCGDIELGGGPRTAPPRRISWGRSSGPATSLWHPART